MFLLNLDLFDSFICFSNLLNRPYFQTFYRFNNIEKYLDLFTQLLNHHLPKLSAHFSQMSIEPNCFALDWFFTIYSKSLPLDVVSRIWDLFFRDGDAFIFRTAIAILSLYEERLCQLDTFHCLQFLTRLPDDLNATTLFKAIDKINFEQTSCELFYLIAWARGEEKQQGGLLFFGAFPAGHFRFRYRYREQMAIEKAPRACVTYVFVRLFVRRFF